jgi:serine/threonine protein phosphatase PrpC
VVAGIDIIWMAGLAATTAAIGFTVGRKARVTKTRGLDNQSPTILAKHIPSASVSANPDYVSTILSVPRKQGSKTAKIHVSAASRRGTSHAEMGLPRQDNLCVLTNNEELVIVVSDGTSSAKESHLGSLFLVQNFERYYRELFPDGFTNNLSLWRELNLKLSQGLVAMYVARSKQKGISTPSEIVELRMAAAAEYASTLEILVVKGNTHTEDLPFAYIRVAGDGGIFEISNQIRELDFGPVDKSNLKNPSVSALPIADIDPEILEGSIAPGNALMIATDGVGDYVTFNSDWSKAFLDYAMNDVPSEQGALATISHFDSNSRDDRSFAIVRNLQS